VQDNLKKTVVINALVAEVADWNPWNFSNKCELTRFCVSKYCKINIIRGARTFVVFVGRTIHEFKIRRNLIPTNTSYPVSFLYISNMNRLFFGRFSWNGCIYIQYNTNQVSDRLNQFVIFKKLERKLDYMSSIYCHKCRSHIHTWLLNTW
jgi:hypothetical protein